ncbi:hypothetical protein KC678_04335 [Candidatus Dojkabacteria bacterium]|uniref:Uncharacterized protein n=1 Tax=Candidatus Dojkabacteria bacterium TaxID=2099670 RepID=A0A955L234_9BACT|nr:hypothetical protein [Candidatus Dojkabacteria bacterium]
MLESLILEEGEFEWVARDKIADYITKPFETIERELYIADRMLDFDKNITFEEIVHYTDGF